jgi:hypothetical protein
MRGLDTPLRMGYAEDSGVSGRQGLRTARRGGGQFFGPGKRLVLYPKEWKSGELIFPYAKAKQP